MEYKNQIITTANSKDCFNAITQSIDKWWGKTDNSITKVGDEFSIFFGETEWRFKITEYDPFKKIYWHCIKAKHVHNGLTNIEKEWLDTKLEWHITNEENQTQILFKHIGLTNNLNCFDVCKKGWDFFISSSLKDFLETGIGTPSL